MVNEDHIHYRVVNEDHERYRKGRKFPPQITEAVMGGVDTRRSLLLLYKKYIGMISIRKKKIFGKSRNAGVLNYLTIAIMPSIVTS